MELGHLAIEMPKTASSMRKLGCVEAEPKGSHSTIELKYPFVLMNLWKIPSVMFKPFSDLGSLIDKKSTCPEYFSGLGYKKGNIVKMGNKDEKSEESQRKEAV